MSVLNKEFSTPYNTAPFKQILDEDFLPAFKIAIKKAQKEIDNITNNKEIPSFKNTIEALEFSGQELDRISSLFFNINAAETNETIQEIAQKVSPLLSSFGNDVMLNTSLFERVKTVYNSNNEILNEEQKTLLDQRYKSFSRNGANLTNSEKDELRNIDKKLSQLKLQFGENLLAESNHFKMIIKQKQDLAGLPEDVKESARQLAENSNEDGWMITLDYPSYVPFMTYAHNRDLRKKLALAFGKKAFKNNQYDNQDIVLQIAKLRYRRATLLGYQTHAEFVLEERMAKSQKKVLAFLNELLEKAKPAAQKEFNELEKYAIKLDNIERLEKWDSLYYSEKLKQKLFHLDEEQLKPFFKLENVLKGAFTIAFKLYDLNFEHIHNIDTYHKDVSTYKVSNSAGELIGILYTDFFPRKGKRNGAWMTSYRPQSKHNGTEQRPHISIVCNFTKPTKTKPSLLSFSEVTTLFHEFGHALHGILANTTYPSLSGTSVHWDFVELPSQIMENWCYEKEALQLFARHYQTDELIPMDLINKIKKSASFLEGLQTMRQLSFGLLDMFWHGKNPSKITDVKALELEVFKETSLFPDVAENCMSTAFAHIFQGGYSSGYYSYKWAEVLDADAFEYFKEHGIFNKIISTKFKDSVLSMGGTRDPMFLYEKFRGQKPKTEALLRRAGLLN